MATYYDMTQPLLVFGSLSLMGYSFSFTGGKVCSFSGFCQKNKTNKMSRIFFDHFKAKNGTV